MNERAEGGGGGDIGGEQHQSPGAEVRQEAGGSGEAVGVRGEGYLGLSQCFFVSRGGGGESG